MGTIIGERLKKARESKGLTQAELAALIGTTPAAISNYEQGRRQIPVDLLFKIAEVLDVSVFWLMGEISEMKPYEKPKLRQEAVKEEEAKPQYLKRVPVFSTEVSAGNGIFPDMFYPIAYENIERRDVDYIFVVSGDSMDPKIPDGARVLVKATPTPKNGKAIVCIYDGYFLVKYFHKTKSGTIWLLSENKDYPPIVVEANKRFEIIGEVVEVRSPGPYKKFRFFKE